MPGSARAYPVGRSITVNVRHAHRRETERIVRVDAHTGGGWSRPTGLVAGGRVRCPAPR